jgi:DNA-binding ferritin-like protein
MNFSQIQLWRLRARQARQDAEDLGDCEARRTLRAIAKSYERMADRVAERIRSAGHQSPHASAEPAQYAK